jgi:hypothetical protein
MMIRNNRIFLTLGIAGALCCTALLGVAVAADKDKAKDTSFTRMFPELPPFAPPTDASREQAKLLGAKDGLIDALDDLSNPILSITDPARRVNNPDSTTMTAGMTFLGQFLDHDVTFDPNSPLLEKTNPKKTTNFRTPRYDLDSVYGGGPEQSPELYDPTSSDIKLKVEAIPGSEAFSRHGVTRFDLPRDPNTLVAFLGDRRNDENTILSQLHVAMLRFHNAVIDRLRGNPANDGVSRGQLFTEAQRQVRWHYQWIILHEFLPLTIGQARVDDILQHGIRFYHIDNENPLIPIEFSVAAYRFGHSQIRPSYRLNFGRPETPYLHDPFFVFIFDDTQDPNNPDPNDLRGFKRAPRRFVDWQTFFKFDATNSRPNKRIDGKLSSVVMLLPGSRGPAPGLPADGVQSLASRNLMRHVNFGIPSGQAIARTMGVPVLTPTQLNALTPFGMEKSTPLWFYILKEAELMEDGLRLGPVGGRIVGEVFIGLLKADNTSYLAVQPNWTPVLGETPGEFHMTDLLTFAGVVPPL